MNTKLEEILLTMIAIRKIARELKDYEASDIVRDMLKLLGAEVEDHKGGSRYYYNGTLIKKDETV
jgi:cysteinyl-tRNA synthetase